MEFGDELLNAVPDFVADKAHSIEALSSRIVQLPVEVAFASEERANVPAAHGDDDVAGLDCVGGEDFGLLFGKIDALFPHGFDNDWIDGICWGRSGGADFDGVAGERCQEAGGNLGAAGVVNADEEDGRLVHGSE